MSQKPSEHLFFATKSDENKTSAPIPIAKKTAIVDSASKLLGCSPTEPVGSCSFFVSPKASDKFSDTQVLLSTTHFRGGSH